MKRIKLSYREKEVLLFLAGSLTEAQVADKLGITPYTVHTHRTRIHKKLDAHWLIEAIGKALFYKCITQQEWFISLASNGKL